MVILKIISEQLVSGSDWNWTETIAGYPASEYPSLKILLQKKSDPVHFLEITGTVNGDSFDIAVTAAQNSDLSAGDYYVQAVLTAGAITKVLKQPDKFISELLSSGSDPRTNNEIVLDNLKAQFKKLSARECDEVTVDGWTYKYRDLSKLQGIINTYQSKVNVEQGIQQGPKIYKSRFV